MGYRPDPLNFPPAFVEHDAASETSPPYPPSLEQAEAGGQAADPAHDGPGVYSWDTVDEQGRAVRRGPAPAAAEPGAATTYNAGYSDRQA